MVARRTAKEETMTNSNKLLSIVLAVATVATGSLAGSSQALARGKGGKHIFVRSAVYYSAPVYVSCWKWIGGKKVWVCY
jgi:hypothetical protein